MKLRPYQVEAINALRAGYAAGHRRQMLAMPTGSGKTATVSAMIQSAAKKGNKSLDSILSGEKMEEKAADAAGEGK